MTIGPRQRLRPALLVSAAFAGMVVASAGWMITAFSLDTSRSSIAQVDQGAQTLATQLADSRDQLTRVADDLEKARAALSAALTEEAESRARMDAALAVLTNAEKDGSRTPRQVLAALRNELTPLRIGADEGGSHLRAAEESLQMITEISQDAAARRAQSALAAVALAIDGVEGGAADQGTLPSLMLASNGLAHAMAEAQAETLRQRAAAESARAERDEMAARLLANEQQMSSVAAAQVALLSRLSEHADLRIGSIEGALRETGVNLDKLLGSVSKVLPGMGGPMISLPELPTAGLPPEARLALSQLESKLERQARLRALNNVLPLTPPVDNFYVSSGYGSRRDPFTNQWAAHTGLDLVAQEGSTITLPAGGKVVKAEFDEGYGRMVEVDHGFGIRTRYAHLNKVKVMEGEVLERGAILGTLGNSGRSSGPHLHYEVLLEGKPVDPLRFMERGRHVCES